MAIIRTFFAGVRFLMCLVVVVVVGWLFREDISGFLGTRGGENIVMAEPSEELAMNVEETLRELMMGKGDAEIRLTETGLQSYLQYRINAQLPSGVDDLAIDLTDSTMLVTVMLDLTRLAVAGAAGDNLRRIMGDSAKISGEIIPEITAPGQGKINILSLQAGVLPVPPFLIATAIQQIGFQADGAAVVLTIPDDIVQIRVENEEIILIRDR